MQQKRKIAFIVIFASTASVRAISHYYIAAMKNQWTSEFAGVFREMEI